MKVEIKKNNKNGFSIDVKRFYLPFELKWTCPNCQNDSSINLDEQYLSYPDVGVPFNYFLYCNECDYEEEVQLQLDLELKVVE